MKLFVTGEKVTRFSVSYVSKNNRFLFKFDRTLSPLVSSTVHRRTSSGTPRHATSLAKL
jgi:hypothetical protein